jgi:hypothetical protein
VSLNIREYSCLFVAKNPHPSVKSVVSIKSAGVFLPPANFSQKILTLYLTSTYELYPPKAESSFRNKCATPSLIGWRLPAKALPPRGALGSCANNGHAHNAGRRTLNAGRIMSNKTNFRMAKMNLTSNPKTPYETTHLLGRKKTKPILPAVFLAGLDGNA